MCVFVCVCVVIVTRDHGEKCQGANMMRTAEKEMPENTAEATVDKKDRHKDMGTYGICRGKQGTAEIRLGYKQTGANTKKGGILR